MIRISDLTQSFFTFWKAAQDKEQAEQLRLWQELYESKHREVFQVYFSPPYWGQRENLPEALKRYEEDNKRIRKIADAVEELVSKIVPKVLTAFDTREDEVEIDVIIFVGTYGVDGFCFPVADRWTIFLALERLSYYGDAIRPLVAHELSHGFYFELGGKAHPAPFTKIMKDPSFFFRVAPGLFMEGLAVAASKRIVPGLEERTYLLYTPKQWEWCQENRATLMALVLNELENQDQEAYFKFFTTGKPAEELPYPRAGYYIGYLAIEQLLNQHSLRELAEVEPEDYPQMIGAPLQQIDEGN